MKREHKHSKEEIEQQLNEKILSFDLLKETDCSFLYLVAGEKRYVLKLNKKGNIGAEYDNHRRIYECWKEEKHNLTFKIPQTYFLSTDKTFYVMEYIKNGINLLEVLFQNRNDTDNLFRKTGRCLKQYHDLATKYLYENRQSFLEHNTVKQILKTHKGPMLKKILNYFDDDSYRIIFKDFKPTNVVIGEKDDLYFLDFQKIYYYAPFYYDLTRFVDAAEIFSIVKKPVFSLLNFAKIKKAMKSFLQGYEGDIDESSLKKMQIFHRQEHFQMKKNKNRLNAIVLKLLYWIIRI